MVINTVSISEEMLPQLGAEQQNGVIKMPSDDQVMNWKKMREVYAQLKKEYDRLKHENEKQKKEHAFSIEPSRVLARETLVKLLDCGDVNVRLQAAIFLLKD